jgi:hypothetical protein
MGNNVQIAPLESSRNENAQLLKGINHECDAPLSLLTFFDKAAVRTMPAQEEPIDDINRRFHLGETAKLLGAYRMSIAKFITTRPPELAEAVFTFGPRDKNRPDIIRLRATDHIKARDKNFISAFYLVWQTEVFPDPKDYGGHALSELVGELTSLVAGGITQNVLLAIISRIGGCERLSR